MKTKCVSKYVYRAGWCRTDNSSRTLKLDFPKIDFMFHDCHVFNVSFYHINADGYYMLAKAWRDKHGNVVVRIFHEDKQTKINFSTCTK